MGKLWYTVFDMKKVMIEVNPEVCFGKPVFAGTRIPVYMVLELLAAGKTSKNILSDYYPSLTKESVQAAIKYSAKRFQNEEVVFTENREHRYAVSL
jgi:uncharacterized protein (DUF433 family)